MGTSPSKIPSTDCFKYPYETPRNILPEYNDVFDRPLARLVASFARFGKKVMTNKRLAADVDLQLMQSIVHMCDDSMEIDDFDVLISRAPPSQESRIMGRGCDLIESMEELQTCQQLIIPQCHSKNKWSISLVTIRTATIDVYLIGDILSDEMEPYCNTLQQAVTATFPNTQFTFKQRLQLRTSLKNDPVLTAYLFSWYLHSNANYLELDDDKIDLHKFEAFEQFKEAHDKYFGCFTLENITRMTHPFVEGKPPEDFSNLERMGWTVIDVTGDGHCGYYALILGLENLNVFKFSYSGNYKAERMLKHSPWQEKILQFRRALRFRSRRLIKEKINEGTDNEPKWWIYVCVTGEKSEIADLSNNIWQQLPTSTWFPKNLRLKAELQMNFMWVPLVVASYFKIRVIVIMMSSDSGDPEDANWTTNVFSCDAPIEHTEPESVQPHLSYKQMDGVVRLSDKDFKKKNRRLNCCFVQDGSIIFCSSVVFFASKLLSLKRKNL